MAEKRFRIPDEDVKLYEEEVAVTQTWAFQRLFHLKQLGLAYLIYPAATHVRAAHSIQCLQEAQKILNVLEIADTHEVRVVRMAALLHDIGHIPFSHTLEDENKILDKHDGGKRLEAVLLDLGSQLELASAKELVDEAKNVLLAIAEVKGYNRDWKSDLVGNTVCADLLAYINADAKWTGIEKRAGYYRMYEYFTKHDNRLCIRLTKGELRSDILSAIEDVLDMRYALSERVIFHHAKCIASGMLGRAARLCGLTESSELMHMGDELFLEHMERMAVSQNLKGAKKLLEGLRSRRLYKRIYKIDRLQREAWDRYQETNNFCIRWRNMDEVDELLNSVEDENNLPRGSLVLWCSNPKAGMKLVEVQVIWHDANGALQGPKMLRDPEVTGAFQEVKKRVDRMEEKYLDLWKFWIGIDRDHLNSAAKVIKTLERKLEINCDRLFLRTLLQSVPGLRDGWEQITTLEEDAVKSVHGEQPPEEQIATMEAVQRTESVEDTVAVNQGQEVADANVIQWPKTERLFEQQALVARSSTTPIKAPDVRKNDAAAPKIEIPQTSLSDEEVFQGIFGTAPNSAKGNSMFAELTLFFRNNTLGSFVNQVGFLRAVKEKRASKLSQTDLRNCFKEEKQ